MTSFKSMSIEELDEFRADRRAEMSVAKREFRAAGAEIQKRVDKAEVAKLKAERKKLDAQIEEKEGSDG